MSYVNKKVSLYGTAYEFLEQIAQTFENNTVIPFTVTRTNLPYDESVTDTPSVTCDWDNNVRIVITVNGKGNNSTPYFNCKIMQKNLNANKYEDALSSYSLVLSYQDSSSYNNNETSRKVRFIFCKNNEAVNIIIRNYNESFCAGIFSDVTTSESPIRLFGYRLSGYATKIQDSSFDSYYRISYYNPPIEHSQIILKYQANVNYYYDSYNTKYLTTLKNMSSISFGNTSDVDGTLYNLTTKSGKKTYLINNTITNSSTAYSYYGLGLEAGSEVT